MPFILTVVFKVCLYGRKLYGMRFRDHDIIPSDVPIVVPIVVFLYSGFYSGVPIVVPRWWCSFSGYCSGVPKVVFL